MLPGYHTIILWCAACTVWIIPSGGALTVDFALASTAQSACSTDPEPQSSPTLPNKEMVTSSQSVRVARATPGLGDTFNCCTATLVPDSRIASHGIQKCHSSILIHIGTRLCTRAPAVATLVSIAQPCQLLLDEQESMAPHRNCRLDIQSFSLISFDHQSDSASPV